MSRATSFLILSIACVLAVGGCTVNSTEPPRHENYYEREAYHEPYRESYHEPYREPVREPVHPPVREPGYARGELLGRRQVNFETDHDTIHVGKEKGKFHAVQIVVEDRPVVMENIRIRLGDGSVVAPGVPKRFEQSGTVLNIDLPGEHRYIEQIAFTYRSVAKGAGRAVVSVYGR